MKYEASTSILLHFLNEVVFAGIPVSEGKSFNLSADEASRGPAASFVRTDARAICLPKYLEQEFAQRC